MQAKAVMKKDDESIAEEIEVVSATITHTNTTKNSLT
jgi:hypothetical protein